MTKKVDIAGADTLVRKLAELEQLKSIADSNQTAVTNVVLENNSSTFEMMSYIPIAVEVLIKDTISMELQEQITSTKASLAALDVTEI